MVKVKPQTIKMAAEKSYDRKFKIGVFAKGKRAQKKTH